MLAGRAYAMAVFTGAGQSAAATFAVSVLNSSTGSGQNVLMSFGIDVITPTRSSVSDSSRTRDTTTAVHFPSFGNVACFWTSPARRRHVSGPFR